MTTATSQTQQLQGNFAFAVRVELLKRSWTVTRLAQVIGKSRNNTSIAINHDSMFPDIKTLIRKELALS